MSTLFLLSNFQTLLVYICHCSMSHVSCFFTPAALHSVTLCEHPTPPAPVHIRTSVPSQSKWYMRLFIVHFVYELLHCLWNHWGTFLQSSFMNSPVHYGHSVTVHHPQQVIRDSLALLSHHDFVQQVIQWSATTSTHSTVPGTSPTIITTALIHRYLLCLCVTYCLYFSIFTTHAVSVM